MMKNRVVVTTLVAAVLLFAELSLGGNVVLIGNTSIPVSALNQTDINNIFLGGKNTWDDGSKVIFVIQKHSACHDIFLKNYINKTPSQFSSYWKKQVFTGKGFAPRSLDNDQEMIKFVSKTKGAIGYVSSDTGLDNVKVITVK